MCANKKCIRVALKVWFGGSDLPGTHKALSWSQHYKKTHIKGIGEKNQSLDLHVYTVISSFSTFYLFYWHSYEYKEKSYQQNT
jgi:hypothetical protein